MPQDKKSLHVKVIIGQAVILRASAPPDGREAISGNNRHLDGQ